MPETKPRKKKRVGTPAGWQTVYDDQKREEALKILIENNFDFAKTMKETGIARTTLKGFLNAMALKARTRERMQKLAELEEETIEQKKIKYERAAWDAKVIIVENILGLSASQKDIVRLSQALRAIHWTTMEPIPDPGDGAGGNATEGNILAIITNQILQVKQYNQNDNPNGTKSNRAVRDRKKLARQSGG